MLMEAGESARVGVVATKLVAIVLEILETWSLLLELEVVGGLQEPSAACDFESTQKPNRRRPVSLPSVALGSARRTDKLASELKPPATATGYP